ncbi:hypothetical protein KPL40_04100 [Clostridium gasigenes]|uniref:hypothetical protein n=1 Tax=Clostridium gasigenes TaxID=94869 RepID=UPI001C0B7B48|nr:hypothetical protein [Clostridium gasigenes]MBU3131624.1 hypothetical protein [Clostridium gasigenes]
MKTDISKELIIKNNLLNYPIKNVSLSSLELIMYKIKLKLNNIDFKEADEIEVILKNIKTRDIFIAEHSIENYFLNINLKSLSFMCTDNEFMLLLIIKKDSVYSFLNPIIKNSSQNITNDFIVLDLIPIEWYLRILDNGELRLSTIVNFF